MNRCDRCNVSVEDSLDNCPLCGAHIEKAEFNAEAHFNEVDYSYRPANQELILRKLFMRISVVTSIAALFTVFIVDLLCNNSLTWSWHILVGIAVFWLTFARMIFFQEDMRRMTFVYVLTAMFLAFYMQYCITGIPEDRAQCWALEYVAPSFQIAGVILLSLMALVNFRNWNKYALPITLTALTSLLPFLIYYFIYKELFFMHFIAMGVSMIIIAFLMIFGRKKYFLEYKKKFHF